MIGIQSKNKEGFTLVEMMVVICILAILVAVALPNFLRARREADANLCVTSLKQIESAKERWAWSSGAGLATEVFMTDLVPDFIRINPNCPGGGEYTPGTIQESPTCSIGTNTTEDIFDDHQLPY